MTLIMLDEGWMKFGSGRRWRMRAPEYLVEVDEPGNVPNYGKRRSTVERMRQVRAFFQQHSKELGALDAQGLGVDMLTANSFTESLGTVPGRLTPDELKEVYKKAPGSSEGQRLHQVVLYAAQREKYLERREPGYVDPVSTPSRVSLGSHHVLISTALQLMGAPASGPGRLEAIVELVCRLPGDAAWAAELAVKYFNRSHGQHHNQPPLMAATYNAGSPRPASNPWNLRQYGEHLDRWIAYYNTSRSM